MFFTTLTLGGLFFVLAHHIFGADWSVSIRRFGENLMVILPLMLFLSTPIVLNFDHLYEWADPIPHHNHEKHHNHDSVKKLNSESTIKENHDAIIITERSIHTDKNVFAKMLYDDGKIEEVEYQIYLKWFDEFIEEVKVDYVIYIKATAEKCFERIKKRNRSGESEIPLDYLIKCGQYHDDWIIPENNLVIDNNNQPAKKYS